MDHQELENVTIATETALSAIAQALLADLKPSQVAALASLLTSEKLSNLRANVEPAKGSTTKRFYTEPEWNWQAQVCHLVSLDLDGTMTIDQIDQQEKYQQRVRLTADEFPQLLGAMLSIYLGINEPGGESIDDGDSLGDLDDHPF